jgi:hypothetical protein
MRVARLRDAMGIRTQSGACALCDAPNTTVYDVCGLAVCEPCWRPPTDTHNEFPDEVDEVGDDWSIPDF